MDMISKLKTALGAGVMMMAAGFGVAAEPPPDFEKQLGDMARQLEEDLDALYARIGPLSYDPKVEAWYIGVDPRLGEVFDRMTVRYLADTEERAAYARKIAKGQFKGSEEDHARFLTDTWLREPFWPRNAAVYDPERTTNLDSILKAWRAAEAAGPAGRSRELSCAARWTDRKPVAALAAEFAQATDMYLAWSAADPMIEAALNPHALSFFSAAEKERYLRSAIANALMSPVDLAAHPPGCAQTFTYFDAWAEWTDESRKKADPFSGAASPEEETGSAPLPKASSGD